MGKIKEGRNTLVFADNGFIEYSLLLLFVILFENTLLNLI